MAKRKKQRSNDDGSRAPIFVDRLSFPPPASSEEWGKMRLTELVEDLRFLDYHDRCFHEIIASGRVKTYVDVLTMTAHIGRLPEFDEHSYGKFLQEARNQQFSPSQLRRALELILVDYSQMESNVASPEKQGPPMKSLHSPPNTVHFADC